MAKRKSKMQQIMEKIIENAVVMHPENKAIHGAWLDGEYQFVTDGYRAVCNYNPVDLPEGNEERKLISRRTTKWFTDAEQNCTEEIILPELTELKTNIKGVRKRVLYRLGDELAFVNVRYLIDLMECIGATTAWYNPNRPKTDVIMLQSDAGKAILLPVGVRSIIIIPHGTSGDLFIG